MARLFMCPVCANVGECSMLKAPPICRTCGCEQVNLGRAHTLKTMKKESPDSKWYITDKKAVEHNARIYQKFFTEVIEPMGKLNRKSRAFRENYAFIFREAVDYTPEEREELSREAERITRRIEEKVKREEATRPRCPTCTSTDIRKIGTAERGVSAVTLGVLSNKVGKTFQCNHCGYTW